MSDNKTIEVPTWYKPGNGHMYRRSSLASSHPESEYSYIKNTLKLRPEDYGVYSDRHRYIEEQLQHKTRAELIEMVADLEESLEARERAGF